MSFIDASLSNCRKSFTTSRRKLVPASERGKFVDEPKLGEPGRCQKDVRTRVMDQRRNRSYRGRVRV